MAKKLACLVLFLVFSVFFFLSPVPDKKADQLIGEQISELKELEDADDQGRNTAPHQTSYSYDVFLSFCGPDTRHSFTGSLYHALTSKGFKVFMDDQTMKPGDRISRTLVTAIRQSRISIVVLSQNYASSTWCLNELVEILECMRLKNQLVWPVFYRVAPSDVRHQRKSYAEAMAEHDKKFGDGSHEVQKWRRALTEVAGVNGWPTTGWYDYELIEEIVTEARAELKREQLYAGEHIIGQQGWIEEVKSTFCFFPISWFRFLFEFFL